MSEKTNEAKHVDASKAITTAPTEIEISEVLIRLDPEHALIVRRLAFQRDVQAAELRRLRQQSEDSARLDWLNQNLLMKMGWSVGVAPAGNISVTSVISQTPTPIREAIDKARKHD